MKRFGCDGFPGFNVGFGPEAEVLTEFVKAQPNGVVEDSPCALVVNLEQQTRYISLLDT